MSRSLGLREDQQWGAELARLLEGARNGACQWTPNPTPAGAELAREGVVESGIVCSSAIAAVRRPDKPGSEGLRCG